MLDKTPFKQILRGKSYNNESSVENEEQIFNEEEASDLVGLMLYFYQKEQVQFKQDCDLCLSLACDAQLVVEHSEHRK